MASAAENDGTTYSTSPSVNRPSRPRPNQDAVKMAGIIVVASVIGLAIIHGAFRGYLK